MSQKKQGMPQVCGSPPLAIRRTKRVPKPKLAFSESHDHGGSPVATQSQSLFSSQSSCSSSVTVKAEEDAWVQCEKPDCLKWRRVTKAVVEALTPDEPWYCDMNADENHASCKDPEEDYQVIHRKYQKRGYRYVHSTLPCGSLVWAKMTGFCRWPGIITPDPVGGMSVAKDYDGDPLSYHVEFLGEPHSHSWVSSRLVELYGKARMTDQEDPVSTSADKRRRNRLLCHCKPKMKRMYRRYSVSEAMGEAESLLKLSSSERLQCHVQFTCQPEESVSTKGKKRDLVASTTGSVPAEKMSVKKRKSDNTGIDRSRTNDQNQGHDSRGQGHDSRGQGHKNKHHDSRLQVHSSKSHTLKILNMKQTLTSVKNERTSESLLYKPKESLLCEERVKTNPAENHRNTNLVSKQSERYMNHKEGSQSTLRTLLLNNGGGLLNINRASSPEGQWKLESSSRNPPALSRYEQTVKNKYGCSTSMVGRSVEETFTLDLEMYCKNQQVFEQDVRDFLYERGCVLRRLPVWRGVSISLFQLFLAVWERGGFWQVQRKRLWSQVYNEVVGQKAQSCGETAKNYYTHNLLAYELFLRGQEMGADITGPVSESKVPVGKQREKPCLHTSSLNHTRHNKGNNTKIKEGKSDADSSDIVELLRGLEEASHLCRLDQLPPSQQGRVCGLDLTFYDESPQVKDSYIQEANTASEFGFPLYPDESPVQEVPEGSFSAGTGDSQVLHEMQVLQQELDILNQEVGNSGQHMLV